MARDPKHDVLFEALTIGPKKTAIAFGKPRIAPDPVPSGPARRRICAA